MAWDKNKPAGSQKIRLSDDEIRANNAALEAAFSQGHDFSTGGTQTGKHVHPTFIDTGADATAPTGTNELRLYNRGGVLKHVNSAGQRGELSGLTIADHGTRIGLLEMNYLTTVTNYGSRISALESVPPVIPSGTKMLFKQNVAPSGWTFLAEDNDRAILNTSTLSQGGTLGGSWIISGLYDNGHVLTQNELPATSFYLEFLNATNGTDSYSLAEAWSSNITKTLTSNNNCGWLALAPGLTVYRTRYTANIGAGYAHYHPIYQNGSWRPLYAKVITCRKD
jgi:hypothetical protein